MANTHLQEFNSLEIFNEDFYGFETQHDDDGVDFDDVFENFEGDDVSMILIHMLVVVSRMQYL